jgi:hypothetical protein
LLIGATAIGSSTDDLRIVTGIFCTGYAFLLVLNDKT